ncbi:hypothetical protein NDU88_001363 [Pleurodeles waltl]|uniref:Uncharacterized protein n=1 Tax=Pleurodeles waltl TaxID=8319 RepID=A0AAV7P6U5_PLEWA|nr:hypothetical protein NDU88_001363 [Pleurodeles waltl]
MRGRRGAQQGACGSAPSHGEPAEPPCAHTAPRALRARRRAGNDGVTRWQRQARHCAYGTPRPRDAKSRRGPQGPAAEIPTWAQGVSGVPASSEPCGGWSSEGEGAMGESYGTAAERRGRGDRCGEEGGNEREKAGRGERYREEAGEEKGQRELEGERRKRVRTERTEDAGRTG